MRWYKEKPDEGDLAVITITDVDKNSAYAELEEYEDEKGLIHISEVSRSWVQDVSKEISSGEKTVAQVVEVEDGSIALSLKRVNDKQKKETMSRWNKEKKAEKFLDSLSDKLDKEKKELYEKVIFPMQKEFGSSFTGFELSTGKEDKLKELFDDETVEAIQEVAEENINMKQEKFEGDIELEFSQGDGAERVRQTFEDLGEGVEVKYVSAPKYSIEAWGRNKELAKSRMDNAVKNIREKAEELDGEIEFSKA